MGIFDKLTNFLAGKGWKDKEKPKEEERPLEEIIDEDEKEEEKEGKSKTAIKLSKEIEKKKKKEEKKTEKKKKKEEKTEETKETEKKEKKEEKKKEKETKKEAKKEIKQKIKKIEAKPRKAEIITKIVSEGVTRTQPQDIPQIIGLSGLRNTYEQLLKPKLNDPEIMEVLIANRRQLQHRFTTEINIIDTEGATAGTLKLIGILPEDLGFITEKIEIGNKIAISSFIILLNEIINIAKEKGDNRTHGTYEIQTTSDFTVAQIKATPTFA